MTHTKLKCLNEFQNASLINRKWLCALKISISDCGFFIWCCITWWTEDHNSFLSKNIFLTLFFLRLELFKSERDRENKRDEDRWRTDISTFDSLTTLNPYSRPDLTLLLLLGLGAALPHLGTHWSLSVTLDGTTVYPTLRLTIFMWVPVYRLFHNAYVFLWPSTHVSCFQLSVFTQVHPEWRNLWLTTLSKVDS